MRKPVVRIVLVLSVLTLAGIVALAAAGRHGIVTSQDGRMSHCIAWPIARYTVEGARSRRPHPDRRELEQISVRHLLLLLRIYHHRPPGGFWAMAQSGLQIPFTPTTTMTAKKIQAAVGYVEGPNGVTLSLNADSGGLPGAAIATANVTNLSDYGECCTLATAQGGSGVTVNAGTQYWVVVSTVDAPQPPHSMPGHSTAPTCVRPIRSRRIAQARGVWGASDGLLPGYAVYGPVASWQ